MSFPFKFIRDLNLGPVQEDYISQQLSKVVLGNDQVLYSNIAKSVDPYLALERWDTIFNAKTHRMNQLILIKEGENRSAFGPRSLASPWVERRSSAYDYFKSSESHFNLPTRPQLLKYGRLRPLDVRTASAYLKSDTNSGLPYLTRKSNCKEAVVADFDRLLGRRDPCVLFTRTQESGKTRNVWGYPIVDTLNEMRFYQPLLSVQRRLPWRAALQGPVEVDKQISSIIQRRGERAIVSIDFSAFDASVKPQLQESAFFYIKSKFQSQYNDEIDDIQKRFSTIGLITPDGILEGNHGVPSGSTFTNEVDSLVQYLCAKDFGINDQDMNIQGDDGVFLTDQPELLLDHFKTYGLKVNEEKSRISFDDAIYLQNIYCPEYTKDQKIGGIYCTYRALGRILFPERFNKYSEDRITTADFNSIRTISILENCAHHPLFEDFVKFVATLDEDALQFSDYGLMKYIRRVNKTEGTQGIFNYRLGDDLKGIRNFKTFEILSGL